MEERDIIQRFRDKIYADKSSYKDFCVERGFDYQQFIQALGGMRTIRAEYKSAIEDYISQEV